MHILNMLGKHLRNETDQETWLIITWHMTIVAGLIPLFHLKFSGVETTMAILAIAAGVLILLEC